MRQLGKVITIGVGLLISALAPSAASAQNARPEFSQVIDSWNRAYPNETFLTGDYTGESFRSNLLNGKTYLEDVRTCWHFTATVAQSCGCREFHNITYCCPDEGGSCNIETADSRPASCPGKDKFGQSGPTESAECKKKREEAAAYANCSGKRNASMDICDGGLLILDCQEPNEFSGFLKEDCAKGCAAENYGCTVMDACTEPGPYQCYLDWIDRTDNKKKKKKKLKLPF